MTSSSASNHEILSRFLELPQGKSIQAEYIWLGGTGHDVRSKTKTITTGTVKDVSELPIWNFDGSSTAQAPGDDSEVYLKPVRICPDPFRRGDNILVLCECVKPTDLTAIPTNTRAAAKAIFDQAEEHEPWFGIEQEYTLFQKDGKTPLGWPKDGYPAPQGPYYCGNGTIEAAGRHIVEAHYRCCLYSGITISGTNAEVMPGQWEYQVGPVQGIDAGDQLILSRYLLVRIAEEFGVVVSLDPKPIAGDWNGAGAHCNFSTKAMRADGGYKVIIAAIEKMAAKHAVHIAAYGEGNERRLTGAHETASINDFSFGVANRGASVRIPRTTHADQKGYLEDRRPASNCDPYLVTSLITQTTCL